MKRIKEFFEDKDVALFTTGLIAGLSVYYFESQKLPKLSEIFYVWFAGYFVVAFIILPTILTASLFLDEKEMDHITSNLNIRIMCAVIVSISLWILAYRPAVKLLFTEY